MDLRFLPCSNATMIVVGNNFGNVGFWDVDSEDDDRLYLYRPRAGTISGISMHQHYFEKIFTSCDLGSIRLMDVEKEIFDLVYSSEDPICSLSQRSDDVKCLYFSEGCGRLNIWDERVRKCSTQSKLHAHRINSIDFNSQNYNIMATSSSDGTVTIWDLRKEVGHDKAVQSAYFSPSGSSLVTTSMDDTVGIVTGVKFEHTSMINHNNQTRNWTSSFRAIWGWDDSYIFIGNMERGVDVISPTQKGTIFTLQSPHMSAVPSRLMHTLTMLACLQEPQIRARND
ncbi:dna damage-binding protein cmr1 [Quercus suber]|uniref:Dna damage-binding protein cmr1 n=1 Tax=Quercus suber TaxID=58331 RepID=A0AAW0K244_QUESU